MMFLVYRIDKNKFVENNSPNNLEFKIWRPGIFNWVPHGLPYKYIVYWLFNYIRIFSTQNYQAVLAYKNNELVCSFLVVPKYYKWPFMPNHDLQFTYVVTNPKYLGEGHGYNTLMTGLSHFLNNETSIWYITHESNLASIALAQKSGFQFHAYGQHEYILWSKFVKILKLVKND